MTFKEATKSAEGFTSVSSNGAFYNCVSVADGYHLQIKTPPKSLSGNVRSFFSGHYLTNGFNVQAAFGHQCSFQFFGVIGPGNMVDRYAIKECNLGKMIKSLPPRFCAVGVCAYTACEHLVPIFRGADAREEVNDFTFYLANFEFVLRVCYSTPHVDKTQTHA
jgi:hypothetical protein